MTTTKKYYALIPPALSHDGQPYWLGLGKAETLTSAQSYVDHFLGGLIAEVWVSINGGGKTLISTKNKEGNWIVVCQGKKDADDLYTNNQIHYHHNGRLVSKEDFYKYGFQHEKTNGRTENQ